MSDILSLGDSVSRLPLRIEGEELDRHNEFGDRSWFESTDFEGISSASETY